MVMKLQSYTSFMATSSSSNSYKSPHTNMIYNYFTMESKYMKISHSRAWECMLGLINPHFSNIVYLVIFPNLGINYYWTRVWGTHIEVICHLLHVHAWVNVPLIPIPRLSETTLSATNSLHQLVVVSKYFILVNL